VVPPDGSPEERGDSAVAALLDDFPLEAQDDCFPDGSVAAPDGLIQLVALADFAVARQADDWFLLVAPDGYSPAGYSVAPVPQDSPVQDGSAVALQVGGSFQPVVLADSAVVAQVDGSFQLAVQDGSAVAVQVDGSSLPEVQDGSLPADSRATAVPVVEHFAEHPGAPSSQ
jgi:hypothetical protein